MAFSRPRWGMGEPCGRPAPTPHWPASQWLRDPCPYLWTHPLTLRFPAHQVTNVDDEGVELGSGVMELTQSELVLHLQRREAVRWPYLCLRRYGYDSNLFSFESGRRCQTGQGEYFSCCALARQREVRALGTVGTPFGRAGVTGVVTRSTEHGSMELSGLPGQCSLSSGTVAPAWVLSWGRLLQGPRERASALRPEPSWEGKQFLRPLLLQFRGDLLSPL